MNKLYTLLATATMVLVFGTSQMCAAQTIWPDNPKFLTNGGLVLGLNTTEVREMFGQPEEILKRECSVPSKIEGRPPIVGDLWSYTYNGLDLGAVMRICFIRGYAAGQQRSIYQDDGLHINKVIEEYIDIDLGDKAIRNQLKDKSRKERTTQSPPQAKKENI